jgi:hypothetical protein
VELKDEGMGGAWTVEEPGAVEATGGETGTGKTGTGEMGTGERGTGDAEPTGRGETGGEAKTGGDESTGDAAWTGAAAGTGDPAYTGAGTGSGGPAGIGDAGTGGRGEAGGGVTGLDAGWPVAGSRATKALISAPCASTMAWRATVRCSDRSCHRARVASSSSLSSNWSCKVTIEVESWATWSWRPATALSHLAKPTKRKLIVVSRGEGQLTGPLLQLTKRPVRGDLIVIA